MKCKEAVKIIVLFALLLGIVCIPAVLIKNQSAYMENEAVLFPTEADSFHASSAESYNLWELVKIPQKTTSVRMVDASDFESRTITNESVKELIQCMEVQIRKIQDCKGLPEFEFSEVLKGYAVSDLYMDTVHPNYVNVLGVWAIYAQYKDFSVIAYMDTQTYALFEVELQSETEEFTYQADVTADGFLEYLSFFSRIDSEASEVFFAHGDYEERKMHLYLMSADKNTRKKISYRFSS